MSAMTKAAWLQAVEDCGGDLSQDDLINLVFKDGPNALWTETVMEKHLGQQYSLYRYLTSFFPHRVWNDWNGITELGRVYHAAYLPFDLSIFQRSMQVCDPMSMNECHTDYCEVPRGGVSAIPELEMYKTGFKTKPLCIANIRTSMQAKQIAKFIVDERFQVDESVMNAFYTMALIRMLGHKWVLEYTTDGNGNLVPVTNNSPYNMMGGYQYSYMNPLFPQVGNVQNIAPFTFDMLDRFGRGLTNSRNNNFVARGPRSEPIFELWHTEDWYRNEVLDNPEYIEKNKFFMKSELLRGYTLEGGDQEVIGNFKMRVQPNLPKFAESSQGGLAVVQPLTEVAVDSGNRALHNFAEWDNAPFLLTIAVGNGVGEILTRPALTVGIEGQAILPITGNGPWQYRNDYDKECNEDLNMPHFRKRYEMGFRMRNPDAGWGFISRAKKFRQKPINTCDLRDVFTITPKTQDCSILTIGCNPTNTRVANNIIGSGARKVMCNSQACGKSTIWRLSIRKENQDSIAPNQSPIGPCECGDSIMVFIGDADGDITKQATATVIDIFRPNSTNPNWTMLVELEAPLSAGECINNVACLGDAPANLSGVVYCADDADDDTLDSDQVRFVLDSPLPCAVGSAVTIEYFDADGVSLGTVAGTIVSVNPDTLVYIIESAAPSFGCSMYEDQCTVKVSCDDPIYA